MFKKLSTEKVYYIYVSVSAFLFIMMKTVRETYRIETALLNPLQLVLVGTTLELTIFLFEIPTGIIADKYSRKLSVIMGLILIGFGFILEGVLPFFFVILGCQFLLGLGQTMMSGADEAWIADELIKEKVGLDHVYLKGAQIGQLLSIIGILLSILFGSVLIYLPFIIGGLGFFLLSLFLFIFMKETHFENKEKESHINLNVVLDSLKSTVRHIKQKPVLILFVWLTLFYGLYSEGIDRLWTAHILEDTVLPPYFNSVFWIGITTLIPMVLSILAVEYIKRRLSKTGKMDKVWILFSINILMVLSLLGFALTKQFVLTASLYMTFFIVRRINQPVYRSWMNQQIDSKIRATVLSTYGQLDSLGQIIGGPIIGYIALQFGIPVAIVVASMILSPVIVIYLLFIKKVKNDINSHF